MATKVINTILNMRDNMSKGLLATAKNMEKVDKGSVMDLANLGLCEKFLGQKEDAMEHLAAALEVDPSLDFARTHLEELKASL